MGRLVPNTFNFLVVLFVAIASTSCSYGLAIIGSTIGQPSFYVGLNMAPPGTPGYPKSANLISAYNGVNTGGAILGCGFVAWYADWAGRKRSIQLGTLLLIVGGAVSAGSIAPAMLIVGRAITGLGIGMTITSIPMYQSEVSTPESRGFMCCMHGVMFAVGYSLAAWIGYGCYFVGESQFGWRFPMAFQCAPALVVLLGSPFIPFSPRWLLQQGRNEEALSVLVRLHRSKADPDAHEARREFYQMKQQFVLDKKIRIETGVTHALSGSSNRKRCAMAFGMMFGNMFTGIYVITNYGVILYQSVGLSGSMPLLLNGVFVIITLPCNIFTALYVDSIGRRVLLLVGLAGCCISNIFEMALQARFLNTGNLPGLNAAIFFIFFFVIWWACCLDATQYLYTTEIFPSHIRAQGTAIGMAGSMAGGLVVLVAGPIALERISWRFYFVLIFPVAVEFFAVYFFFPETKQRSLVDIAECFGDKVALHYYHASEEEQAEYTRGETGEKVDVDLNTDGDISASKHVDKKTTEKPRHPSDATAVEEQSHIQQKKS